MIVYLKDLRISIMKRLLTVVCSLLPLLSYSSHYVGGEISWDCLPNGNYRFIMKLYRECNGILYSDCENINVINHPGITTISMCLYPGGNPKDGADGAIDGKTSMVPPCYDTAQSIYCNPAPLFANSGAIEEWFFTSDQIYPDGIMISGVPPAAGWKFTYTSCCRNSSTNLFAATSSNWFLVSVMYPYKGKSAFPCYDHSPLLAEAPLPVLCSGIPDTVSFHQNDPDSDSLAYSWTPALTSEFLALSYLTGFSYTSPMPGTQMHPQNIPAELDINTGKILIKSITLGAFNLNVKTSSFRDGIKISDKTTEYQLVVLPCESGNNRPQVEAFIFNPGTGMFDLITDTVAAGEWINAMITVTDMDVNPNIGPQVISLSADGEYFGLFYTDTSAGCPAPPCATLTVSPPLTFVTTLNFQFLWHTSGGQHEQGFISQAAGCYSAPFYYIPFRFGFRAYDDACPIGLSQRNVMQVVVRSDTLLEHPDNLCLTLSGDNDFLLNWDAPASNGGGFIKYLVYRSIQGASFQLLDSVANLYTTYYTDTSVTDTGNYAYYVKTVSDAYPDSPPGHSNVVNSRMIDLIIYPFEYVTPLLEWQFTDDTLPAGTWYYIKLNQGFPNSIIYDSTQDLHYWITGWDTLTLPCDFRVEAFDVNGCWGSSEFVTLSLAGLKYIEGRADCMRIYPNPASNVLLIRFNQRSRHEWIIESIEGVRVTPVVTPLGDDLISISLDALPAGTYLVYQADLSCKVKFVIIR